MKCNILACAIQAKTLNHEKTEISGVDRRGHKRRERKLALAGFILRIGALTHMQKICDGGLRQAVIFADIAETKILIFHTVYSISEVYLKLEILK